MDNLIHDQKLRGLFSLLAQNTVSSKVSFKDRVLELTPLDRTRGGLGLGGDILWVNDIPVGQPSIMASAVSASRMMASRM